MLVLLSYAEDGNDAPVSFIRVSPRLALSSSLSGPCSNVFPLVTATKNGFPPTRLVLSRSFIAFVLMADFQRSM